MKQTHANYQVANPLEEYNKNDISFIYQNANAPQPQYYQPKQSISHQVSKTHLG